MIFRILEWDSLFFGFAVARIIEPALAQSELAVVLADMKRKGVRLCYWNVANDDKVSISAADACGGRLVEDKTRYAMVLPSTEPVVRRKIEPFSEMIPTLELEELALISGTLSRFNLDPYIPHAVFQELYRTWIRASVSGDFADVVLVAPDAQQRPMAMVTIVRKDDCGEIGLLAVHPFYRKQGVGGELIHAAWSWMLKQGCTVSRVNTQKDNFPARFLYERCGYRLEKTEKVFHFSP